MKKVTFFFVLFLAFAILSGCSKKEDVEEYLMEYKYSSIDELLDALITIDSLAQAHNVIAYLDTLPNGDPDPDGEFMPLTVFIGYIFGLVEVGDLEAAIHEIYRFDGTPFSLISYIMKAEMTGNITPAVMAQMLIHVPLPPIPVPQFVPPLKPKPAPVCLCDNPRVKIRVTFHYQQACGNYVEDFSGYAANNTLNNMKSGSWFRLDAEMHDCKCPGGITWTNTVATTSTSYGYKAPPGPSVGLTSYSSGTFTVTFTGVCACNGKSASATFTISF